MKEFHPEQLKKLTGTLPKVDLNVDNFELWMTVMSAVESADQIWWWIIVVMVHIHHSQPLKIKFGTNHFLGSETFGPIQYREGVNNICMEKGYYRGVTFSDNWSFWWWVGALVCTNHHYQVSRALGLIICTPEYKMLVQNGQKRHFQPTPNIFFAHIFLDFFLLKS